MRHTTALIGLILTLIAAGCDRGAAPPPAAKPAPGGGAPAASAPAAAPTEPIRLLRGPGEVRYRLTMQGFNQLRELRVEQTTEFVLKTAADGSERVEILSAARVQPPARDPEAVTVDADCRQAFGGDAETLARFAFTPMTLRRPSEVIPDCASRDLFGIVTDILMFLSVQSRENGMDRLQAAGDRQAFGAFESQWTQPPDVLHGRIVCAGGELLLESLEAGRAIVRWQPQPLDQGTIPAPRTGITKLLAGTETLAIAMTIDAGTGALIEAVCDADEIELQGWSPFAGETVPDRKDWPKTSGIQMKALRKLKLERIAPAPG